MFDPIAIRKDFPILAQKIYNQPLVYLDNAASAQKPQLMLDALREYYSNYYANIHRGVHYLSQWGTDAYEKTRQNLQSFLGAAHSEEIIFTSGTTQSINLLAFCLGETFQEGDEVLISAAEHHANIVPWQMLAERKKIVLKIIPISKEGILDLLAFEQLLNEKTRLVAITHCSNVLGIRNPVEKIIALAHQKGAYVLLDGAQSIVHEPINVQTLDADFFVFSAHKLYGPTGVGVLYGKKSILEQLPPYQGGGDMIDRVTFEKTTFNVLPFKFEAGTPNIADVIAFEASLNYFRSLDNKALHIHEQNLIQSTLSGLSALKGVKILGHPDKLGLLTLHIEGIHAYDMGLFLDQKGIAVRTGHHCAQPLMDFFGIDSSLRVSFGMYNTLAEVDFFLTQLQRVMGILRG